MRYAYVVSGTIMTALATVFWVALYFAWNASLYIMFVDIGFLLVAGIVFLVYGSIRRERHGYVVSGAIMIAVVTVFFSLFLYPSDAARYCMFGDLGFLLAVGILLLVYGLIRRDYPPSP